MLDRESLLAPITPEEPSGPLLEYDPAFLPADFDVQGFFGGLAALGYATLLVYENVGDYLLALDLSHRSVLEDLHHFYSGRGSGRYADLALKRGMVTDSAVILWLLAAFQNRTFVPADLIINLMNEAGEPLRVWNVAGAVPKKWSVSDLNANESAVVIETLELTYQFFTIR